MKISKILTVLFGLLTIGAGVVFVMIFSEYNHYKNDQEQIIQNAVDKARENEREKRNEDFAWARKGWDVSDQGIVSPLKFAHFKSPEKFGAIEFDYPLTWSVYQKNDATKITDTNRYDVYFDEGIVKPATDGSSHALHIKLESRLYEIVLKDFQKNIDQGQLKAVPYVLPGRTGDDYTGVRLDGKLETGASGTLILLKAREKTLSIRSDLSNYHLDFLEIVLPSLQFIP